MEDAATETVPPEESLVAKWLKKIEAASEEEEAWRKRAKEIFGEYTNNDSYYNILYSNTDILLPTLYSSTPTPDVRRRFGETDKVAKYGSDVIERILSYEIGEYEFDYVLECVVLDTLLPGRGVARVKYVPVVETRTDEYGNKYEQVVSESAECEYVKWEDFRRSPGKIWSDVTWIAYKNLPNKADVKEKFGEEIANALSYNMSITKEENGKASDNDRTCIWEVWDKESGQILFIAENYKEKPIKTMPPTVSFKKFFDTPRPMQFILRTDSLVPVPEYDEYRQQAKQLAMISRRIAEITKAVVVRGIYDSTMQELARLFDAGNNEFIPADNSAAMYERGGIDKMIWMMPVQELAAALQYLYQQREQTKAIIFEISGVSDILRGASRASETLGAQELKAQYATTRLKRRQREVQRYVRDLLRLKAEIISEHFAPETLLKISNINPQELQQYGIKEQQILEILRNETVRDYRIDIQTDSTIAMEDKSSQEQMTAFLQAINQFFAMVGPLVQQKVMSMEAAKKMLMTVSRKFKMGDEFEASLDSLQEPPTDDTEAKEKEAELMLKNKDLELKDKEIMLDNEKNIAEVSLKAAALFSEEKKDDQETNG